jgi:hypothetical protein
MTDTMDTLSEFIAWWYPVVMLAGAVVCVVFSRLSPRFWLLALVFVFLGLSDAMTHALFSLIHLDVIAGEFHPVVSLLASLLDLLGGLLLVIGLAWTLSSVNHRIGFGSPAKKEIEGVAYQRLPDEAAERWDSRRRGSQDIQQ